MKYFSAALLFAVTLLFSQLSQAQVVPPEIVEIKKAGQLVVSMTRFDNLPFYGNVAVASFVCSREQIKE